MGESKTPREHTAGASAPASYSACWLLKVSLHHPPSPGDGVAPCPHGGQHHYDQDQGGGEDERKTDRKRQHPSPYRHARDDLINQAGSALSRAPGAARWAKPAPLAGKRHQLLVSAVSAAQAHKTVGQNAAFEKGLELVFDGKVSGRDRSNAVNLIRCHSRIKSARNNVPCRLT